MLKTGHLSSNDQSCQLKAPLLVQNNEPALAFKRLHSCEFCYSRYEGQVAELKENGSLRHEVWVDAFNVKRTKNFWLESCFQFAPDAKHRGRSDR